MKRLSRRNMTGPRAMYYAVAPLSTAKGRLPIAAAARGDSASKWTGQLHAHPYFLNFREGRLGGVWPLLSFEHIGNRLDALWSACGDF